MSGFADLVNEEKIKAQIVTRVALEAPRKAAGEFIEGESYPTTGDDTKLTSELLDVIEQEYDKLDELYDKYGFGNDYLYQSDKSLQAIREAARIP